ncbi:MAG: hypothetical protein WDW38_008838 [Sanguina aurantia]
MEIYYTNKVQGRTGTVAAWSKAPGYPALLAVALSPNAIGIYNQEGKSLEPTIKNVRGSECSRLAWHPIQNLLAIVWKDGAVSFWNADDRHLEEDSKIHRTVISMIAWNASGERLATGDDNGRISFWKTDRQMRPIHVVSYDEAGCKIKQLVMGPTEAPADNTGLTVTTAYYTANSEGKSLIKWANDQGYSGAVQEMTEEVHTLIYYAEKEQLLVVSASCTLSVLGKDDQTGNWVALSKMKFATGTGGGSFWAAVATSPDGLGIIATTTDAVTNMQEAGGCVVWAGNHTLASASEKDSMVRMFNFDTEDNYVLPLTMPDAAANGAVSRVTCLASDDSTATEHPAVGVNNKALSMEWGCGPRLMTVVCADAVNICRKTQLSHKCRDGYVVIQAAVDQVMVESIDADPQRPPGKLQTEMQIMGLDVSKGVLLVWSGSRAETYKVTDKNEVEVASSFETTSKSLAIINDSIFRTADHRIEVVNHTGVVKQTLSFDDAQGSPVLLDLNKDFLAALTDRNIVRVFKVAGRDAKPHAGPGAILPASHSHLKVDCIRVNGVGTMVAALATSPDAAREPTLFVYFSELSTPLVYDFSKDAKLPQVICWDVLEPKLLGVQTMVVSREDDCLDDPTAAAGGTTGPVLEMAALFVSGDNGILLQEYQHLSPGTSGVVGLAAPFLLLHKKSAVAPAGGAAPFTSNVTRLLMQGFAGMQDADAPTKRALLDFSYNLAMGNMDEAFRSVKAIKSVHVWENMAHLCIKNKRLDVAEHCLGNMQHARGARALREAKGIEELDARVAAVAVHLGMLEDAKKLYIAADRYDLLNHLLCACGQWDRALEVAEKHDRIHLKSTHYTYAQAEHACHTQHPLDPLHTDCLACLVPSHRPRWAHFLESHGQLPRALECYEKAGDSLSVVRIHCHSRDFAAAEEEVVRSGDMATAFHLARQYESQDRIQEAIRYYTASKRYSHGVRLAKLHQLDSDLMNLALKSTPVVMVDTADYLHERGHYDKAATLYMKGGKLKKAVEMCFSANLFDVLTHITDDLKSEQNPELYVRCAEFFMTHGHNDKAVKMLIAAGQYSRALELCVEHDVTISEDMAESMTPDKAAMPAEERNLVLDRIAKVCKRQGSFQLAAKKGGDTEKIVFFAGVSRQKEIYLMAANYLQTLDWHADPEVLKNITTFYTKAQAYDSLAAFYEACAQIEIDEYRDYEKALQAMREACKQLGKSKSEGREARLASLSSRIGLTESFVRARVLNTSGAHGEALALCNELLNTIPTDGQDHDAGIRVGDVFALMVEHWWEARNPMEAYKLIEAMRRREIIISPYLDQRMVEDIYRALGLEVSEERRPAALVSPKALGLEVPEERRPAARVSPHGQRDDDDTAENDFVEEEVPESPRGYSRG